MSGGIDRQMMNPQNGASQAEMRLKTQVDEVGSVGQLKPDLELQHTQNEAAEAQTSEIETVETQTAETANTPTPDTQTGNLQIVDLQAGNAQAGDAQTGNAQTGDRETAATSIETSLPLPEPVIFSATAPTLAPAPFSGKFPSPAATISSPAKFRPTQWLLRGIALGLTAVVSTTVGLTAALTVPLPAAIAPQNKGQSFSITDVLKKSLNYPITRPVNILVMGIDLPLDLPPGQEAHVFAGRSDTMMLVRLDPTNNTANVLSIPRDTQVVIPDEGMLKINQANVIGGAKSAAQAVSQNLNGVTIDRYVRVSTGAFREMVDLLGGVDVYVPIDMKYVDETQRLNIDLKAGMQTLDGKKAEQFARFRNDQYGDIGRVQRQQQMIRALREKLMNPAMLTKVPEAIQIFQRYIDTNLSSEELLALAGFALRLDQDNFHMVMLPGRFSGSEEFEASYWLMDPVAMDQVMHEYFDMSSVAVLSQQSPSTDLRIAIQNASGSPDVGTQMMAYLQNKGFTNVYVIDDATEEPQTETQIIVQRGDLRSASTLKSMVGTGKVISASTGDLESDLTLRVGSDWQPQPGI
jgi:polyisoprenyl-teichoic acid--peptidoglycan teichoic acid transferase